MESILKAVTCSDCKLILQSPLILPCFNSVCSKHVLKAEGVQFFYCRPCECDHPIPTTGFAPNSTASLLIDLSLSDYKKANDACEQLESTISQMASFKNDPQRYIQEAIGLLKNNVRLRRKELIREIECKSEHVLVQLCSFESECVSSLNSMVSSFAVVDINLERKKLKLDNFRDELRNLKGASESKWQSILVKCDSEIRKLIGTIDEIKKSLLLKKYDVFKRLQAEFCNLRLLPEPTDINGQIFQGISKENTIKETTTKSKVVAPCSGTQLRLSEEEVECVFNNGKKLLTSFARRLLDKYFTTKELAAKNYSIMGQKPHYKLDPVRINFIKRHLIDRNEGRALTKSQWYQCMQSMTKRLSEIRNQFKKEKSENSFSVPTSTQTIVKIKGPRGNNLHDVEAPNGETFIVSMPVKFRKSVWTKRGDFVIVEPIEEGNKVKAEITQILDKDHIRYMKSERVWPKEFEVAEESAEKKEANDRDMFPSSEEEDDGDE